MLPYRLRGLSLNDPVVANVGNPAGHQSKLAQIDPVHGMW